MSKSDAAMPAETLLPALRQDLELIEAAPDINGASRWLIYDPLQHRFTAIGRGAHVLLQVWSDQKTAADLVQDAWEHFSETIHPDEVHDFIHFLQSSRLTLDAPAGGWKALAATAAKQQASFWSHLLHTYLFFRVPLAKPEQFLRATLRRVRFFGTQAFAWLASTVGIAGLYLVSREWDDFRATFSGIATIEGAALLGAALMLVKLVHELAHAYVATAFGCRVPVLGVAFILGTPLLYCDVTDAWRLQSRKARLRIDLAGIFADLTVACFATFLWAFLGPGLLKHFLFSLATAGWVLSLTMNLNPFMKFDGYHIASDIIGIENMQDRAMALGRWRLRELLFATGVRPPDRLPRRVMTLLAFYAWAIWIYRLIVFTGIALVVYHFFFKLAGIVLFAVEIGYFIIAPMVREIQEWWKMRRAILSSGRGYLAATGFAGLAGLLVMPLSSHVRIPAVLETSEISRLHPQLPAQTTAIKVTHGDRVEAGTILVSLNSTELTQEQNLNRLRTEIVRLRLDRGASDVDDRAETAVLENQLASLKQQSDGLAQQRAQLDITAPFAGQIVEVLPALHVDRMLHPKEVVLVLRGNAGGEVRGTLDESDLWRLKAGADARFVPDDINLPTVTVQVNAISKSAMPTIDQVELASSHGGRVADRLDAHRQPVPVSAQYAVRGNAVGALPDAYLGRSAVGVLVAQGAAESALSRSWRQILKVLVRESGM